MSIKATVFSALMGLGFVISAHASVVPPTEAQKMQMYKEELMARSSMHIMDVTSDPHILFNSRADAVKWVKDASKWLAPAIGGKVFQVLDNDARYATLQSYVHDLWTAYTELYPEQTKGLNEPPVVLVQSDVVNAFITRDPNQGKIVHAVVVLSALIDAVGGVQNRAQISGVIGHELAHSVFRHGLSQYAERINRFFDSSKVSFGYLSEHDQMLDTKMNNWVSGAQIAGDVSANELMDLPSPGIGPAFGFKLYKQMLKDFFAANAQCAPVKTSLQSWLQLFNFSSLNMEISLTAQNRSPMQTASQTLINSTQTCFGANRKPMADLLSEATGIPADVFRNDPDFSALCQQFDKAPTMMDGLRGFVHIGRDMMQTTEKSTDMSHLGFYTFEENADDHSAIVHAYLAQDPNSLSHFFEKFLGEDQQACQQLISSGAVPKAGSFSDEHRSTCYRIYHLNELVRKMSGSTKDAIRAFARDYAVHSHDSDWNAAFVKAAGIRVGL